mmetsp:Transcript_163920/g.525714  ORF Transcript_163920/g.525714 Transcript_163920/m.525714 type:complete len:257 (+) Transcript_163920:214-984(+)
MQPRPRLVLLETGRFDRRLLPIGLHCRSAQQHQSLLGDPKPLLDEGDGEFRLPEHQEVGAYLGPIHQSVPQRVVHLSQRDSARPIGLHAPLQPQRRHVRVPQGLGDQRSWVRVEVVPCIHPDDDAAVPRDRGIFERPQNHVRLPKPPTSAFLLREDVPVRFPPRRRQVCAPVGARLVGADPQRLPPVLAQGLLAATVGVAHHDQVQRAPSTGTGAALARVAAEQGRDGRTGEDLPPVLRQHRQAPRGKPHNGVRIE